MSFRILLLLLMVCGCSKSDAGTTSSASASPSVDAPPPDPPTLEAIGAGSMRASINGQDIKSPKVLVTQLHKTSFALVVTDGEVHVPADANEPCTYNGRFISVATNSNPEPKKAKVGADVKVLDGEASADGKSIRGATKTTFAYQVDEFHLSEDSDKPSKMKLRLAARLALDGGGEAWLTGTFDGVMCNETKRLD